MNSLQLLYILPILRLSPSALFQVNIDELTTLPKVDAVPVYTGAIERN